MVYEIPTFQGFRFFWIYKVDKLRKCLVTTDYRHLLLQWKTLSTQIEVILSLFWILQIFVYSRSERWLKCPVFMDLMRFYDNIFHKISAITSKWYQRLHMRRKWWKFDNYRSMCMWFLRDICPTCVKFRIFHV